MPHAAGAAVEGEEARAAARSRRLFTIGVTAGCWWMAAAFAAFSTYLSMLAHHHSLARLFAFELVSFAFIGTF